MLRSLNSKFYGVVVMLLLLFVVSYGIFAYFFQQQERSTDQVQSAIALKTNIAHLNENFQGARLWEKVILFESKLDAERKFADSLQQIRTIILELDGREFNEDTRESFQRLLVNINNYETFIAEVIQLRTKETLLNTRLMSTYQSITSSIVQAEDAGLIRPLYGVTQFFLHYQGKSGLSQFKALEIVALSLEKKILSEEGWDLRLKGYLKSFIDILNQDHALWQEIDVINREIERTSADLLNDFTEASNNLELYILDIIETSKKKRSHLRIVFLFSTFVGTLLLLFILLLLKSNVIGPVVAMVKILSSVKNGDMTARFQNRGENVDEISEMGLSLNTMLDSIAMRDQALQEYHEKLEEKLEELSQQKIEQEQLTLQLQRVEKMKAVGALAGGVAHDLNNILSGVVSYPELLLMDMPESSPYKKPLVTIQESGKRAVAIVQDLLTLARRGAAVVEITNLNQLVKKYLASPECQKLVTDHPDITFSSHLEESLANVKGSRVHLMKSIMNLVTNGIESITGSGTITITTSNCHLSEPVGEYEEIEKGAYVSLVVRDTGEGISPEDLKHIFEPFFTRKEMGRSGTGLGLAVVWGTVSDHNGYIEVLSSPTEGTVFTLYFPASIEELSEEIEEQPLENFMGAGETVLVVDDVEYQRDIGSQMLEKLGYSVRTASSGEEAVSYLKENHVDLLVLDMLMPPGMDGLSTYKEAVALRPGIKAIIVSGYSETERVFEAQRLGVAAYIRKPYSIETIGEAIRRELLAV